MGDLMTKRTRFLLMVMAVASVVGVVFWWLQPSTPASQDTTLAKKRSAETSPDVRPQTQSPSVDGFEHAPLSTAVQPVVAKAVLPPLPPADIPLLAQMDSLIALAMTGEPVAACRLALDSVYCRSHEQESSFMRQVNAGLGARTHEIGNDLAATLIINAEDSIASGAGYCAGLAEKELPNLDEILSLALPNLSTRQKILLVLSRPNGALVQIIKDPRTMATSGGDTRHVYSQFMADHALEFLAEGIAAADPMALEGMILVHVPSRIPDRGVDVFPSLPNPYKFAGYALLLKKISGPASLGPFVNETLDTVVAGLGAEQLETLQRAVDIEAKRWQRFQEKSTFARIDPKKTRASSLCAD